MERLSIIRSGMASLALLGTVVFSGCSTSNPPQSDESRQTSSHATNASGHTYGSALGAKNQEDEPDLIAVVATNGKSGYVLKTDLYGDEPSSPAEAMETQRDGDRAKVAAAIRVLEDDPGVVFTGTIVDYSEGASILEDLAIAWGGSSTEEFCSQEIEQFLEVVGSNVGPNTKISPSVCKTVIQALSNANQHTIPVYESNGVTVIGDFNIG